jgi:MFS family permease
MFIMAVGLFSTLLGIRSTMEGFTTQVTGFVMAGYFAGILLGARYAIRVLVLGGHIRAFAVFASVMSTTALIHIMFIDPWVWGAMRFIAGFCMAGLVLVTESWLNDRSEPSTRGQVFSFYMITNYAAAGLGQFLLPLADPAGFYLFTIVSIIFSISIVPILITQSKAPLPAQAAKVNLRALYAVSPVGMVGATIAGFINSSFYAMGPVFAASNGLTVKSTSIFMACVIFSGLFLQWPIGKISDRVDRRLVLITVALVTACACIGFTLLPIRNTSVLFILASVYGAFSFVIYSVSAAHTNDFADRELAVQTAGGLLVFYGIGAIAGPIVASQTMGLLGASGLFMSSAIAIVIFAMFAYSRIRIRATRPIQDKSEFVVISDSQPISRELYASLNEDGAVTDPPKPDITTEKAESSHEQA